MSILCLHKPKFLPIAIKYVVMATCEHEKEKIEWRVIVTMSKRRSVSDQELAVFAKDSWRLLSRPHSCEQESTNIPWR
jgi:hypothetical protein